MAQAGHIHIECPPSSEQELVAELEKWDLLPESGKWSLKANPSLTPGEFLLKSDLGDVDGRHVSRIRKIREALEHTK